jgi:hypothetical protein
MVQRGQRVRAASRSTGVEQRNATIPASTNGMRILRRM